MCDTFGDEITTKKENILRVGFQNIGGFPTCKGKLEEDLIQRGISKWDFDIFGCMETNVDWRLVSEDDKLMFQVKEWWQSLHLRWSHNTAMEPVTARQFGGTAIFKASHRVIEKGADESKLGRWVWTRYRGRSNQTL